MNDQCCGKPEAGMYVCEQPIEGYRRPEYEIMDCPDCGTKGKPVDASTVKANILRTLRDVNAESYRFCTKRECPVVYFSNPSGERYAVEEIRVAVYQKDPDNPRVPICYCFKHTVGEIIEASLDKKEGIIQDINEGIRKGQCACDIRNPQSSCCLGNVKLMMKDNAEAIELVS